MTEQYKKLSFLTFVIFISIFGQKLVVAQDIGDAVSNLSNSYDLQELGGMASRLAPHGNDLMGDMIDKNTGGITFNHTDVSIPGNSSLEVALRRKLSQGAYTDTPYQQGFGDWVLDLPIAYTSYAPDAGTTALQFDGSCLKKTNLDAFNRSVGIAGGIEVRHEQHVSGVTLYVPGKGLSGTPTTPGVIADPKENWIATSNSDDFAGRCATTVIAPDGTKYKFGRHVFRNASDLTFPYTTSFTGDFGASFLSQASVGRQYLVYLVTEVIDVNGNWVRYEYNNTARAELTRIHSNDRRSISLNYASSGLNAKVSNSRRISSVTTNGRTWRYGYGSSSISSGNYSSLTRVTLPDGRFWKFGDDAAGMREMSFEVQADYQCLPRDVSFSMKHPDGAMGTFRLVETRHIKNAADLGSTDDDWDHWMLPRDIPHVPNNSLCNDNSNPDRPPFYREAFWPIYRTMALKSKTISGSGLPSATWNHVYRNYSGGALDQNWTKITGPDDTVRTYFHQAIGLDHGLLKRIDVKPISGAGENITYDYNLTAPVDSSCKAGGAYGDSAGSCHGYKKRPIAKVVQTRDSNTYTTLNAYSQNGAKKFIDYGYPNRERRYSSVPGSTINEVRDTVTNYEHKKTANIIGLTKRVVQNGREMASYEYDSRGRVESESRYGQEYARFTYHTTSDYSGALASTYDAEDREVYRSEYKRGIPQSTRRPDNTELSVEVDNNGWLTSSTDAMSNTTSYERDNMGRITLINLPGAWNNTSVAYDFRGGGVVQTITRGQSREEVTYDKMYRPILERSQALDTNWSSYIRTAYHEAGQVKFKSQPSTRSNESKGTDYTYDGLGRITRQRENISPNVTQTYRYLSNNRHEVTDPLGNKTTSYRDGYSGAGEGDIVRISQPLGVNTTLYRNIWGQLTRVQQAGTLNGYGVNQSQYYYYDSRQRVCRYRTPEGGDTLSAYDDSGYLTSYAKGMRAGTNCAAPSGQSKVTLGLDDLARVTNTNFTNANTPDIIKTYDDNGNVLTNSREGVNWAYTYDELNHLTSERLRVNGRTYDLSYRYDTAENLIERTFPSGRVVTYDHDGLGRETSALSDGVYYANNINYHPSSLVSSMRYGNGQVFTQTLNNRLLPQRLLAQKGVSKALDIRYTYDARSSVKTMNDGTDSDNYQSFSYNGLGSMTIANGPWGTGSFTYDALGNLREKNIDSRQVRVNYNTLNRAIQSTDTAGRTRNMTYDSRGNVTKLGGLNFSYDYSDQPTALSGSSSGSYQYDGNLKRVKGKVDGQTIYNVYDASGSLVHVDKSTIVVIPYGDLVIPLLKSNPTDYIKAAGMTVARINKDEPTYLHPNHLGSPVAGTTKAGTMAWKEQYMPFGEKMIGNAANDDQAGFTGHVNDSSTGLTYMQARYYDPVIGRFLSVDPVGFLETEDPRYFNRYSYTFNNPTNNIDPDGNAVETVWDVANVVLGSASFASNVSEGNYGAAALDAVGVVVDSVAAAVPFVPGGASTAIAAIKVGRYADNAADAAKGGRGQQLGSSIKTDGSTTASEIKAKAESLGFKPTQTANGPLKFVDENGVARATIKGGSQRAPGSARPHVELKTSSGQRVNPAGEVVTRKSLGNHTPIKNDL